MISEIHDLPEIPEDLRVASKEGKLVLFIGAGVSQLAGSPGWSAFADSALSSEKFQNVNYALLDQIKNRALSPRIRLALALDFAERSGITIDFDKILHPNGDKLTPQAERLFQALNSLGRHFVTTNYDRWLDKRYITSEPYLVKEEGHRSAPPLLTRETVYKAEEIEIGLFHRTGISTVVHIHGSLADPSNMVLTTRDYITRYGLERRPGGLQQTRIHEFLEALFHSKTVLFIGYGLDELEILEYVILKSKRDSSTASHPPKHFILQPFFSHEVEVADGISNYYRHQCGVTLLPYLRDTKDFAQLVDVIEYLAAEIPVAPLLNLERQAIMDDLLK